MVAGSLEARKPVSDIVCVASCFKAWGRPERRVGLGSPFHHAIRSQRPQTHQKLRPLCLSLRQLVRLDMAKAPNLFWDTQQFQGQLIARQTLRRIGASCQSRLHMRNQVLVLLHQGAFLSPLSTVAKHIPHTTTQAFEARKPSKSSQNPRTISTLDQFPLRVCFGDYALI